MAHITLRPDVDGDVFCVYCSACDDGETDFETWLIAADEGVAQDLLVDHLLGHGIRLSTVPELPYEFAPR